MARQYYYTQILTYEEHCKFFNPSSENVFKIRMQNHKDYGGLAYIYYIEDDTLFLSDIDSMDYTTRSANRLNVTHRPIFKLYTEEWFDSQFKNEPNILTDLKPTGDYYEEYKE